MLTMAVGQSDDVDPADAIQVAIEQCRAQLGSRVPKAGLLFVAFESWDPILVSAVRAQFPDVTIMGATSAAEMSSVAGYREGSVTLALFAADDVDLTTGVGDRLDADLDGACRAAVDQALAQTDKAPRLCLMLADGIDNQRALEAVRRALPDDVVLVGGGSSGVTLGAPRPTFQFCDDRIVEDGLALMLFSGSLAFSVAVGTGLRPVGPKGIVTASDYGLIREIDGRPATSFTSDYLGVAGPATFGNPLAIHEEGATDSYLRVLLSQDADTGSIRIPGAVPVGATVQFTTASSDDIVAAAGDAVRRAAAAFPSGATPSAALIFSCAVRKFLLGTRTGQEVAGARAILPLDLPLAGMYCTGEIAPVDTGRGSRFLNETFVTVLLGG